MVESHPPDPLSLAVELLTTYVKLLLLVTFTEKLPLKRASFAEFPGFTPVISTVPALPGTMENRQGLEVLVGFGKGGGHLLVSIVTVTRPAVSVEERITLAAEGFVTSTPRTTFAGAPPGVT